MASSSEIYDELVSDVLGCVNLESLVCGKGTPRPPKARVRRRLNGSRAVTEIPKGASFDTYDRVSVVVNACRSERKRTLLDDAGTDTSDEMLCRMARFTDGLALVEYTPFLHYVPRLVNIVRSLGCTACKPASFDTLSTSCARRLL